MAEEITQNSPTEHTSTETAETPDQHTSEQIPEIDAQVKELQQKLEAAQKLADAYKDQLLRKAAEFDNYKKRTETEYASMARAANERLIGSLVPILDDFIRSLKSGREAKDHESFFKGVEMIYNKFTKLLESQGLAPFDSVGKPFNVEYHDALMQMPRSDVPPQTVIEEIERGYKLFDKILRHAKVIVSAEQIPGNQSNGETGRTETN